LAVSRSLCAAALTVLAVAGGCGSSPEPSSGIAGTVEWASCGVPLAPQGCTSGPAPATLRILRGGEVVRVVKVGADGRFRIPLEPGRYEIDPEEDPSRAGWHLHDGVLPVQVQPDEFETLEIAYSGGPICTDPMVHAARANGRWADGRWYP
jgi:hypothetical protein